MKTHFRSGLRSSVEWAKIEPVNMTPEASLRVVKTAHTVIWAFFAGCILAIPALIFLGNLLVALVIIGVVLVEVIVILANRWRCPLTDIAARFTDDREDNFDIYLPLWLARYNKQIFGAIFVVDVVYAFGKWQCWLS